MGNKEIEQPQTFIAVAEGRTFAGMATEHKRQLNQTEAILDLALTGEPEELEPIEQEIVE